MPPMSSVPDYSIEAGKAFQEAANALGDGSSTPNAARPQALATLGVGDAILALTKEIVAKP